MVLITRRRRVGMFGPHVLYSVEETHVVPIDDAELIERVPSLRLASLVADEAR